MSLGTLTIDLAANVAGLESDLGKAQRLFDKNARNFEKTVASTIKVAAGIGAGAAVGFAAIVKGSIDLADSFDEMSQRVNVSAEDLSAYAYQASFANVTQEKLGGALNKFNKVASDTFNGIGKGGAAFDALGISVVGVDGSLKSTSTLFEEVAAKISQFEDGPQKSAIAMQLFGKSAGPDLVPMLNEGTEGMRKHREEAQRLGYVIGNDTAKAAGEFNDNIDRLRKTFVGVANKVSAEVIPELAELSELFQDPETQKAISGLAQGVMVFCEWTAKSVVEFSKLGTSVGEFLAKWNNGIDLANLEDLEEEIKNVRTAMESPVKAWFDLSIPARIIDMDADQLKIELERLVKQRDQLLAKPPALITASDKPEAGESTAPPKGKKKFSSAVDDEYKQKVAAIEKVQAAELSAMLEREGELMEANAREVAAQREKFARIHEERLAAEGKVIELENYRAERDRKAMEAELDLLRQKGIAGAEIEAEYQKAKEDQAAAHAARLKKIEEQAQEEERKKKEEGYANLIGLAETYNNAKGDSTNKYTAVALNALRILSSKEKLEAVKSVGRDGVVAIQKAWASAPFPMNMGPVALATATAGANMAAVTGIAHGGLDYVQKEATYLLDRGERVLSPNQNRDLTNFIARGAGAPVVNIHNYGNQQVTTTQSAESVEIYIGRVVDRLNEQVMRGTGIANSLQAMYGLRRRGG